MKISIETMMKNGLHFGHSKQFWNPKMRPFIYAEKNNIHIIDLIKTYTCLKITLKFLSESSAQGKKILFVGTKKQANQIIQKVAEQSNSFFVTERWLGGLLTNWPTIKKSILKLNNLERRSELKNYQGLKKKEIVKLEKKRERLNKYFGGLKKMVNLPDIVIIIDQQKEMNAVLECKKLGIRSITILDTNSDPNLADLFVPANDDSITSITYLLNEFSKYIIYGQQKFQKYKTLI